MRAIIFHAAILLCYISSTVFANKGKAFTDPTEPDMIQEFKNDHREFMKVHCPTCQRVCEGLPAEAPDHPIVKLDVNELMRMIGRARRREGFADAPCLDICNAIMRAQGRTLLKQEIEAIEIQQQEFMHDQAITMANKASHQRIKKVVGDWIQTTSCNDPQVNDPSGIPPRPSEDERNRPDTGSRKKASGGIEAESPQDQRKPSSKKKKTSQTVSELSTAKQPVGAGTSENRFQMPEIDFVVCMTDSAATQLQQLRLGSGIELNSLQQTIGSRAYEGCTIKYPIGAANLSGLLHKARMQNGVDGAQQALREVLSTAMGQSEASVQQLGSMLWALLKWNMDGYAMVWTFVYGMLWFVFSKLGGQQTV